MSSSDLVVSLNYQSNFYLLLIALFQRYLGRKIKRQTGKILTLAVAALFDIFEQSVTEQPLISARVGTLRRKREVRQFLETMPKEDFKDVFTSAHMKKKQFEVCFFLFCVNL